MLNTDKLREALDIVLSARLIHASVERTKEKAHQICDPHLAIALVSTRQTVQNPIVVSVELAMIDAAATLTKECLEEAEKLQRSIAKTIAQAEVLASIGSTIIPPDVLQELEDSLLQCRLRFQEMEQTRSIVDRRCSDLVSQL